MSLARKRKVSETWSEDHDQLNTTQNQAFENEELSLLYRAIHQLSEADRAVILLYLEEKSYAEISEVLGTTVNNVGVRINRIKERLKKLLHGKVD
jgi:RNA polymerase sigma-70 factor (ECF subfamily)